MTLHASDAAVTRQAQQIARKRSRKYVVAAAFTATALAAGGAWAAMKVSGDGQASVAAYTEQQLQVTNAAFSGPLFPGGKVNLTVTVKNPNPFKVQMKTIALKQGAAPAIACKPGEEQYLSGPLGSNTTYPIPNADQVVVDADNSSATLTIRNAVQLSNSATKGCALTVPFTVTGESMG